MFTHEIDTYNHISLELLELVLGTSCDRNFFILAMLSEVLACDGTSISTRWRDQKSEVGIYEKRMGLDEKPSRKQRLNEGRLEACCCFMGAHLKILKTKWVLKTSKIVFSDANETVGAREAWEKAWVDVPGSTVNNNIVWAAHLGCHLSLARSANSTGFSRASAAGTRPKSCVQLCERDIGVLHIHDYYRFHLPIEQNFPLMMHYFHKCWNGARFTKCICATPKSKRINAPRW